VADRHRQTTIDDKSEPKLMLATWAGSDWRYRNPRKALSAAPSAPVRPSFGSTLKFEELSDDDRARRVRGSVRRSNCSRDDAVREPRFRSPLVAARWRSSKGGPRSSPWLNVHYSSAPFRMEPLWDHLGE